MAAEDLKFMTMMHTRLVGDMQQDGQRRKVAFHPHHFIML